MLILFCNIPGSALYCQTILYKIRGILFLLVIIFIISASCHKESQPKSYGPVPTERQLLWNEMKFYGFFHFGMNTFTNKDWGLGNESPKDFNPTELDCRQWARVCKDAGMKGVILVVKHHDGFCLWPSAYTEHSVKNSPWKNGKGDVVKELSIACKEYGLKFGFYLSPWDRNHKDYGKPEYIEYFRNQLRELLTNYGEIFEVWFDGANGGSGYYGGANETRSIDSTYYDWPNTIKIIRELQPKAVIYSLDGGDVRWIGNEIGWADRTNWSLLSPSSANYKYLTTGQENGTRWMPAEVDVSIRPNWFYHEFEDNRVKSLPQLLNIYYNSIGKNSSLNLNLTVDKRGLINDKDIEQLMKLSNAIKADFSLNICKDKETEATNVRGNSSKFKAANVNDGDKETYWATDDSVTSASIIIDFKKPTIFNRFLAQEYIALGQRVQEFTLEAFGEGGWKEIASETTIGDKRILRLPDITASKIKFNIKKSKACPLISNIEIYNSPKVLEAPVITRNKEGIVSIFPADPNTKVYFTTDGTDPSERKLEYTKMFYFDGPLIVKAIAIDSSSGLISPIAENVFGRSKAKWKIIKPALSEKSNAIIDGDISTSCFIKGVFPIDLVIDFGEVMSVTGFRYLPDPAGGSGGIVSNYELYGSNDGKNWGESISSGEFPNIQNNPIMQEISFAPISCRFVKFHAVSGFNCILNGSPNYFGFAEMDFMME
jgi:alpha-L-fucosidase